MNDEKKYREIFENVIDGIFCCSPDGILIDCNPALQKMLGHSAKRSLLRSRDNIEIYRSFGRKKAHNKNFMLEAKLKRKDGSYFWTEINSRIVKDKGSSYCIGTVRNIDEKKKAEEKINYLSRCDSFTGLYNRHFFEEELKRIDSSNILPVSIMIADINGLKLINSAFGHQKGDEILLMVSAKLREIYKESNMLARWGGDEFSAIMPGIDNVRARSIKEEVRMLFKEINLGGLELSLAAGVSTKVSEEQKIWEVVRNAEDMMFREKLLEKQSAHGSVIFSLNKALGERNYETAEHVSRLSNLVKNFGAYISLDAGIIHDLELLAALHDIGKIAIPDNIVLKSSKLTDEEYEMMKKHSEIGYKIAKSIPEIDSIATTILTHHERWDGKGYPLKLEKENIPLNARILSIVDSFDAITNDRPYQNALSDSEAMAEILKCAGTQFDPVLAEKFAGFLQLKTKL